MPLSSSFVQILVALQVNLLALSMGANMGWVSGVKIKKRLILVAKLYFIA